MVCSICPFQASLPGIYNLIWKVTMIKTGKAKIQISPMVRIDILIICIETLLGSKVKKLVEDKSRIGPGYYDILDKNVRNSPKAIWGVSKTGRKEDMFIKKTTLPTVGPGSYDV